MKGGSLALFCKLNGSDTRLRVLSTDLVITVTVCIRFTYAMFYNPV